MRITNEIIVAQIKRKVSLDEFKKLCNDGTIDVDLFVKNKDEFKDAISECDATTQGEIKAFIYNFQHPRDKELEDLKKKVEELKKEKNAMEDRALQAEKKVKTLNDSLADAEKAKNDAEKAKDNAENAQKDAEAKLADAEKEKADAQKKLADAAVQIAASAALEARAQKAEEDLKVYISKTEITLKANEDTISQLEQELEDAKKKQSPRVVTVPQNICSIFGGTEPLVTQSSRDSSVSEQYLFYKDKDEPIDAELAKALVRDLPKLFKESDFTWWYVLTLNDGTIIRDEPSKVVFKA